MFKIKSNSCVFWIKIKPVFVSFSLDLQSNSSPVGLLVSLTPVSLFCALCFFIVNILLSFFIFSCVSCVGFLWAMDLESNKGGFKNELTKRIKISKARASKKIVLAFLIEVKEGEWLQWTARFQSAAEVNCVQVSSSPVGALSLLLKLMISHWRQSNLLLYPVDIFPLSSSLLLSISLLLFVSPHLLFINYTYMVTYIIYFCSLNPKPSGALFVFILQNLWLISPPLILKYHLLFHTLPPSVIKLYDTHIYILCMMTVISNQIQLEQTEKDGVVWLWQHNKRKSWQIQVAPHILLVRKKPNLLSVNWTYYISRALWYS